jgi:hypothetical protein
MVVVRKVKKKMDMPRRAGPTEFCLKVVAVDIIGRQAGNLFLQRHLVLQISQDPRECLLHANSNLSGDGAGHLRARSIQKELDLVLIQDHSAVQAPLRDETAGIGL